MGIDISGGMIVGVSGRDFAEKFDNDDNKYSDIYEMIEEEGLDRYCLHYDADIEDSIVGFGISDCNSYEELDEWFENVKNKFKEFESEFGLKPSLIGTQDVW